MKRRFGFYTYNPKVVPYSVPPPNSDETDTRDKSNVVGINTSPKYWLDIAADIFVIGVLLSLLWYTKVAWTREGSSKRTHPDP